MTKERKTVETFSMNNFCPNITIKPMLIETMLSNLQIISRQYPISMSKVETTTLLFLLFLIISRIRQSVTIVEIRVNFFKSGFLLLNKDSFGEDE